jgi:histidyl-tRNA synthetase
LISDVELAEIYVDVFKKLKVDVDIKINSRKILYALAEVCKNVNNLTAITIAIDKLDKIGIEKVTEELKTIGLDEKSISLIENYINIDGSNLEKLEKIEKIVGISETGKKGIEELKFILGFLNDSKKENSKQTINIDFTLARGLNYYTGTIYEVKAKNVQIGSIGGGGRYDDLTGLFGVPNMPGVGISFGLDRIYDVMDELKLFPGNINQSTEVLFFNLGEKESRHAFQLMQKLRKEEISCELFYENSKLEKQFKYASKKNISYAIIIGSKEMEEKNCVIKDLQKGEQQTISENQLIDFFKK